MMQPLTMFASHIALSSVLVAAISLECVAQVQSEASNPALEQRMRLAANAQVSSVPDRSPGR